MHDVNIHKKVNNFFRALKNLKEIEGKEPPFDTITEAGMVSLFEMCFEQSWKEMRERLEYHGYGERKLGSPNAAFYAAALGRSLVMKSSSISSSDGTKSFL